MATPGELHHLHNHAEEIMGGTKAGINRQYDEIIISLANDESRIRQQLNEGIARQPLTNGTPSRKTDLTLLSFIIPF
jgi:hypothetical protein